jgi:hypothetical protein
MANGRGRYNYARNFFFSCFNQNGSMFNHLKMHTRKKFNLRRNKRCEGAKDCGCRFHICEDLRQSLKLGVVLCQPAFHFFGLSVALYGGQLKHMRAQFNSQRNRLIDPFTEQRKLFLYIF